MSKHMFYHLITEVGGLVQIPNVKFDYFFLMKPSIRMGGGCIFQIEGGRGTTFPSEPPSIWLLKISHPRGRVVKRKIYQKKNIYPSRWPTFWDFLTYQPLFYNPLYHAIHMPLETTRFFSEGRSNTQYKRFPFILWLVSLVQLWLFWNSRNHTFSEEIFDK